MATYRIDFLNGGSDIVDPKIEVKRKLDGLDPDILTIDVTVYFIITSDSGAESKFGLQLFNVPYPGTLESYNYTSITSSVMTRLQEYLIP